MLKEKIQQDLNKAVKEKQEMKSLVLRMLLAAVLNKEKEKRYKLKTQDKGNQFNEGEIAKESQLADEQIIEVILSEVKKRKEAILGFEKGERKELAEKEKKELEILQKYLPERRT